MEDASTPGGRSVHLSRKYQDYPTIESTRVDPPRGSTARTSIDFKEIKQSMHNFQEYAAERGTGLGAAATPENYMIEMSPT